VVENRPKRIRTAKSHSHVSNELFGEEEKRSGDSATSSNKYQLQNQVAEITSFSPKKRQPGVPE